MINKAQLKKFQGLQFCLGSFESVTKFILDNVHQKTSQIILPTSLHDLSKLDSGYDKLYQKVDLCTTDGMPLVWYFKLTNSDRSLLVERVYGPDLIKYIVSQTPTHSHVLYATNDLIAKKIIGRLFTKTKNKPLILTLPKNNPAHQITSNEEQLIKSKPDIIWIGIGSPFQIQIATRIKEILPQATIVCVGAAFEFISGFKRQAPIWMQKMGLEWLFRLFNEPRRLYKRYAVQIPSYLIKQAIKTVFHSK